MMSETVADEIAAMLVGGDLQRVYCKSGVSTGTLSNALQREPALRCIELQHEESISYAAVGESMLTGRAAACSGSSGRDMLLFNGFYEATRSGLPLLALVPHIPVSAIGSRYIQDFNPMAALRDCTVYCETAYTPEQAPQMVTAALRTARATPGAGVVVLPVDVVDMPAANSTYPRIFTPTGGQPAVSEPEQDSVVRLAELINNCDKVVFLCGRGCEGGRDLIVELARRIGAPIAYTLRAKDIMEKDNPCAVGMVGLLGWGDAPAAVQIADLLVLWGTDFPHSCFLPQHGQVVQIDTSAAALGRRVPLCHAVHGDAAHTAARLLPLVRRGGGEEFLQRSLMRHGKAVAAMESTLRTVDERAPMSPEYLTRLISSHAEPDAVFAVDIGPPVVWVSRYLQAFGNRRIIGSFNFGTSACALPMAIGAKAAYPSRQVIALCHTDSHPSELLTLLHEQLSVKVLTYNHVPPPIHSGSDIPQPDTELAAYASALGLPIYRLNHVSEAAATIRHWLAAQGPAVLDVALTSHPLTTLPQSDLLRTLDYMGDTSSAAMHRELTLTRRILFGNNRLPYGKLIP